MLRLGLLGLVGLGWNKQRWTRFKKDVNQIEITQNNKIDSKNWIPVFINHWNKINNYLLQAAKKIASNIVLLR